jgi:hypothetical protein
MNISKITLYEILTENNSISKLYFIFVLKKKKHPKIAVKLFGVFLIQGFIFFVQ